MRDMQKELMKEYNEKIAKSSDKETTLFQIIKKEKRTWLYVLENIFFAIAIITFIWGYSHGAYETNNIVIDCNTMITQSNNQEKFPTGQYLLQNLTVTKTQPILNKTNITI